MTFQEMKVAILGKKLLFLTISEDPLNLAKNSCMPEVMSSLSLEVCN